MNRSGKPPVPETEPQKIVVDETVDLLGLYELAYPTEEAVKEILEQHYNRFGRIGFSSSLDEQTVAYFSSHFIETPREYLVTELAFIQEITAAETRATVLFGFERARNFLPEQQYEHPQMIMVLNGKRTDAKVIGAKQFGVNLQNLFSQVATKDGHGYDLQRTWEHLTDISAHEASHLYLKQIEHSQPEIVHWAVNVAFVEGLAVLSETEFNYPWSADYLAEATECLSIVRALETASTEAEKIQLINRVCEMEALQKHKPNFIEKAKKQIADGLAEPDEFDNILRDLLVRKNGPLYYAGYSVWKRIQEDKGIEGIKEVVKKGPTEFAAYI